MQDQGQEAHKGVQEGQYAISRPKFRHRLGLEMGEGILPQRPWREQIRDKWTGIPKSDIECAQVREESPRDLRQSNVLEREGVARGR